MNKDHKNVMNKASKGKAEKLSGFGACEAEWVNSVHISKSPVASPSAYSW